MSVLLAEQNTNMALKYATYGYILENGRVVMDGESKSLRENEDVKEFYLGVGGERPQELPRREVLQAAQALAGVKPRLLPRTNYLVAKFATHERRSLRPARDARPRPARACAVQSAARSRSPGDGESAGLGGAAEGRRSGTRHIRGRRSPSCRCCASRRSRTCRPRTRPSAASPPRQPARSPASSCRPARSSSPRASARTGGARRARCSLPASARATSCTTRSPIT